ncbi:Cation efflux family protein [Raineyella antarctica]|uniref:Cation efflux family protein n=2 Tax=Raineyella antarctica TaxID=1577474 RepID=A0A1G6GE33_9ACTN|nr:Cation efflux family protein [Raineyella antarctica]
MGADNAGRQEAPVRQDADPAAVRALRRTALVVVALNLAYFFVEVGVALAIRSVSLFADSVDFLEDTAVNLLIFIALGWSLRARARAGKAMAGIIVLPALAAVVMAVLKFADPERPDPLSLVVTAGGAIVVNSICAWLLARHRHNVGSMSRAAFLAARNDVYANAAIIALGVVTIFWASGWPDIVLGMFLVLLNFTAAKEVWEVAEEEDLAAKALAGEAIDDD